MLGGVVGTALSETGRRMRRHRRPEALAYGEGAVKDDGHRAPLLRGADVADFALKA